MTVEFGSYVQTLIWFKFLILPLFEKRRDEEALTKEWLR